MECLKFGDTESIKLARELEKEYPSAKRKYARCIERLNELSQVTPKNEKERKLLDVKKKKWGDKKSNLDSKFNLVGGFNK